MPIAGLPFIPASNDFLQEAEIMEVGPRNSFFAKFVLFAFAPEPFSQTCETSICFVGCGANVVGDFHEQFDAFCGVSGETFHGVVPQTTIGLYEGNETTDARFCGRKFC